MNAPNSITSHKNGFADKKALLIGLLLFCVAACSPGYVLRSAYEQGKILARREKIDSLLAEPKTPEDLKLKLKLVQDARLYAISIGLNPKNSFTQYSKVDSDVLAWIVMGAKMDSFSLHTWWFPIVGSVPYKGYFEKKDADEAAKELQANSYETWVRGTEAFSTLGWFNDPVLSTTLKHSDISIANTVIHESVHTTFWLPGHVTFNESLANYIATVSTCDFFRQRLPSCPENDSDCIQKNSTLLNDCNRWSLKQRNFAAVINNLYNSLLALYNSAASREEKLMRRNEIFSAQTSDFKRQNPSPGTLEAINNAEIMQLKIYLTGFSEFDKFFQRHGGNINAALSDLESRKDSLQSCSDPFAQL